MYQGRRKKGGGEGAIPSDLLDKNPISIGWEADYAHQITTPSRIFESSYGPV